MMKRSAIVFVCLLFLQVIYCKLSASTFSKVPGGASITTNFEGTNYVSSYSDNVIYQIDGETGEATVFAGTGTAGYLDGNVLDAEFNKPIGITVSIFGDMYVCDYGNNAIRKISQGVVKTVAKDITEPIQIVIQSIGYGGAYTVGDEYTVAPLGIYVVTANGQVILLDDSPENDICEFATDLGTISSVSTFQGSTKQARNRFKIPCKLPFPSEYSESAYFGVWYTFNGDGNQYSISNCFSETGNDNVVLVFRDSAPGLEKCSSLICMNTTALHYSGCLHEGGTVSVCTQPNITFYLFVGMGWRNDAPADFQVEITNLGSENCASCQCGDGLLRECGLDPCDGYCSNTCSDGKACDTEYLCVEAAPNSVCTGALPLDATPQFGNLSLTAVSTPITAVGECRGRNPKLPGYWYTFQGTGTRLNVSTCGGNTNRDSMYPYLFQGISGVPCSENLICPPFSDARCGGVGNIVTFCSVLDVTYYAYVSTESYDLPMHATYQVSLFDTQETCTPGDLHGYDYYTSFWYDIEEL